MNSRETERTGWGGDTHLSILGATAFYFITATTHHRQQHKPLTVSTTTNVKCQLQDLWDILQATYVSLGSRGRFGQLMLNTIRGGVKGAITFLLRERISSMPPCFIERVHQSFVCDVRMHVAGLTVARDIYRKSRGS